MNDEKHQRIKIPTAAGLLFVAAFVDLFQFLLTGVLIGVVLSPLITVGATTFFWIIYKMLDIPFVASPKRLVTFATQSLGELVPFLNALPLWTIGTLVTIIMTRAEDGGSLAGKMLSSAKIITARKRVF